MKNKENWKLKFLRKRILIGLLLGTAILMPIMPSAYALPSEGAYASSNVSEVVTNGSTMEIAGTKENNLLNWQSFSIANGESVKFTNSNNYLNLVKGLNKSTIDGFLSGKGDIYLVNPNGIIFGSNAKINVGSLIASTRSITNDNITDFEAGKNPITNSTINSVVGNITNLGNIKATSVILEGNEVIIKNAANITTSDGTNPLTSTNVTIKADDITVGHKVENQVDLAETTEVINNAADYKNTTISSSGYSARDLEGNDKDITEAFLVEDIYDLQNMNANLTANYLLANDIDASETSTWSSGFSTIGDSKNTTSWEWYKDGWRLKKRKVTNINAFGGNFNGAGNIISGLKIDKINQDNVGLFGYVESKENTSIKNVGLENANIIGNDKVGGLVGYVDGDIEISNSYNTGSISGSNKVGGLVGGIKCVLLSHGKVEITDSYNTGIINGSGDNIGGLVGGGIFSVLNEAVNFGEIEMNNSYNSGNISGSHNVGGLVGGGESIIVNSYNTGIVSGSDKVGGLVGLGDSKISNSYNTGSIHGDDKVGGLAGNGNTTISNSYNTGSVSGEDDYVGGLVGRLVDGLDDFGNTTISNSYNTGNISGSSYIGGLVGRIENHLTGGVEISNSYNAGIVNGRDNYIGGLVGHVENFIISEVLINNSYNTGTVNGEDNYVGGLVGRSKNFSTSKIKINNSYNIGSVNGGTDKVGGLVGDENAKTSDSYYAITDSNGTKINQESNDVGIGKTYDEMLKASTYGFKDDIDIMGGQEKTWRMYEGYTTPMLKSFMQTVEVKDVVDDVYNGLEQTGEITTTSGASLSSNIYGNKGTNAGIYAVYSDQQGYDLVGSNGRSIQTYTINPKELTVSFANGTMTYGRGFITWDKSLENNNFAEITGFVNGESINNVVTDDGKLANAKVGLSTKAIVAEGKTNNVGVYNIIATSISENLKNYTIKKESINAAGVNKLSINPKELKVFMNDVTMTYGDAAENWADNSSAEKNRFTSTKYSVSGFAYDEASDSNITNGVVVDVINKALDTNADDNVLTENVGSYDVEGAVTLKNLGNYYLSSPEASKGTAKVDRATLTLTADGVNVYTVDDTKIDFNGTISGFANGDSKVNPTFSLELLDGQDAKKVGEYAINGKIGGVEVGNYSDNYTVVQADGNETAYKVTKADGVVIPDVLDNTVQSVLDGENKDYHETLDVVEDSDQPSVLSNEEPLESSQNNKIQIINNNRGLRGIATLNYDKKFGVMVIPSLSSRYGVTN